jgi:hypothetical protein
MILLKVCGVSSTRYILGQFPHPEVMPVLGYEENKEID